MNHAPDHKVRGVSRSVLRTTHLPLPMGGERSEVAVVNDGPVDRQSRDRGAPQCAGRPNGLTERVLTYFFCIVFLKYGTLAPSQSRPLWVRASSPIGRAKGALRAL